MIDDDDDTKKRFFNFSETLFVIFSEIEKRINIQMPPPSSGILYKCPPPDLFRIGNIDHFIGKTKTLCTMGVLNVDDLHEETLLTVVL